MSISADEPPLLRTPLQDILSDIIRRKYESKTNFPADNSIFLMSPSVLYQGAI